MTARLIATLMLFAAALSADSVADHLLQTPVESYPFDWGEGVQMMGLMKVAALQHNASYIDYVERWTRFHEATAPQTLLNIGPDAVAARRIGYCGRWSPATAALYLYEECRKPEHLKLSRTVIDFIRAGAERSPEGGLGHWNGSHQYWVDTLFMACPLLVEMGKLENQPALIDDAAHQIILYARRMQDPKTGLFYHMWDWQTNTHSEGFWGRGNGWVLMSLADTMEGMNRRESQFGELERIAQKLTRGLAATQSAGGMWHTVLDDPSSYAETSATAMFTYGLLKLSRLGILPASSKASARAAWKAINEKYVRGGVVIGVSGGTGPHGVASYLKIPVGSETWGAGSYLLAASEAAR